MVTEVNLITALVTGMNRYRAWIDRREFHVALASLLLAGLVGWTLNNLVCAIWLGWWWGAISGVALIPLEVYLCIAQMTSWRWDGPPVRGRTRGKQYDG